MFIGLVIYFSYGRHNSRVRRAASGALGMGGAAADESEAALAKASLLHSDAEESGL